MPELELRWAIQKINFNPPYEWCLGINFTHDLEETYVCIGLIWFHLFIGKMLVEKRPVNGLFD